MLTQPQERAEEINYRDEFVSGTPLPPVASISIALPTPTLMLRGCFLAVDERFGPHKAKVKAYG